MGKDRVYGLDGAGTVAYSLTKVTIEPYNNEQQAQKKGQWVRGKWIIKTRGENRWINRLGEQLAKVIKSACRKFQENVRTEKKENKR